MMKEVEDGCMTREEIEGIVESIRVVINFKRLMLKFFETLRKVSSHKGSITKVRQRSKSSQVRNRRAFGTDNIGSAITTSADDNFRVLARIFLVTCLAYEIVWKSFRSNTIQPRHPMTTRATSRIVKPVERLNLHIFAQSHALQDPYWRQDMNEEYHTLLTNGTWVLVPRPPKVNVVWSMWFFRHK
ncbi:hypothetical protein OSB04_019963 [Centaurea solstitialis]|uniref:Uncharacterized protein n=1 Tax=Centaurea solstitialis TaxID=347529 RepID=A0AA38T3I6_9ASTR|nr:hypothetical protein OSB04_019963 [Centaurea solstitialis]